VPVALFAVGRWLWALAQHAPILFGEGAVAHAAVLARTGQEYGPYPPDAIFVAANYPPLYFHLAGLGDPFITGRVLSIGATLFVVGAIGYRARRAGWPLAVVLAASFVATMPVAVWGAALKPDLVALALIVGAVLALDARRAVLAGALAALAIWTKPTEALPAFTLLGYLAFVDRRGLLRGAASGLVTLVVVALVTHLPDAAMFEHVWRWNQLEWHPDQAFLLLFVGLLIAGVAFVAFGVLRPFDAIGAYAVGAFGVALLGGREGATVNYLLDILAATWLALATAAPRLRNAHVFPVALAVQLLVALVLLDPLGVLPGRAISTGAWASPDRARAVHDLAGAVFPEDAGLLVVEGRPVAIDDLFLWSRLHDRLNDTLILDAVRGGAFNYVVSEVDLTHLDSAPLWEQQRWHPALVAAVLSEYRLSERRGALFVYARVGP
jgi:hypothetical protein